ncbi:MAG: GtrA family protein, partial [Chloroflexota bacterium]
SKSKKQFTTPLDRPIIAIAKRFGGDKAKELERFLKFAVVGVTGAVIDLGLLAILQSTMLPAAVSQASPLDYSLTSLPINFEITAVPLHFNVALATTIAFISAVLSNFIWTTLWVYPDSRSRSMRRQLVQFATVSVIGWSARTLWITTMYVTVGAVVAPLLEPFIQMVQPGFVLTPVTEKSIGSIVAQLVAMVVVMLWNFFANRYWTYNDVS